MKVIFADDSVTMRKVAEITFASDDYELLLASDGAEVVAKAKEFRPEVVILDSDMPQVDGYEACRRLRKEPGIGQVPVLFLTGPSSPWDEKRGQDAGSKEHLDKPFETQVMLDKVKDLAADAAKTLRSPAPPMAEPQPEKPAARPPAAPSPAQPAQRTQSATKTRLGIGPSMFGKPSSEAKPASPEPTGQRPPAPPISLGKPKGMPAEARAGVSGAAQAAADKSVAEKTAGLPAEQVEIIRQVSREVIEQVVWEVVPDLAETIIKEELAKLLRE